MAQSRFPLQIKRSKEEGLKPGTLAEGEPAVNLKDKVLYVGMEDGEVIGINAGLPHRTKLKLDTKLKIRQDEGVVVPGRYEVTENGELTIEDGGVFVVLDDKDEEEKIYAYDSQRLGNIPAEDYFDYLNPQRFSSLQEAINAVGSAKKDLLIKGNIVVDTDLVIPENINLVFARNGKITINSGVTLTINGGIQAGLWQIFDGDGEVTGNPKIEAVYPEWFGAKGDGEYDDTEAIQKSILFYQTVKFFDGCTYVVGSKFHYQTSDGINVCIYVNNKNNIKLFGNAIIRLADGIAVNNKIWMFGIENTGLDEMKNIFIKDLTFDMNGDNNLVPSYDDYRPTHSVAVVGRTGWISNVIVENCKFINNSGANSLVIVSDVINDDYVMQVNNVLVKECKFTRFGRAIDENLQKDHSCIYIGGKNIKICNCVFEQPNAIDKTVGEGAIDLHGSTVEICHNVFINVHKCIYCACNSPSQIRYINISSNYARNCQCFVYFTGSGMVENISIDSNYIEAVEDPAVYDLPIIDGSSAVGPNTQLNIISITGNRFGHDISETIGKSPVISFYACHLLSIVNNVFGGIGASAIHLHRPDSANTNRRLYKVHIEHNIIYAFGYNQDDLDNRIAISVTGENDPAGQHIIIVGNFAATTWFTSSDQIGLHLAGSLDDIVVRDNDFSYCPVPIQIESGSSLNLSFCDRNNVGIVVFSDGDTTPSVFGTNTFKTNNTSATSITTFDDGAAGQEITVIFGDSNTTIVHGSGVYLKGGANVTPSANTTMKFVYDGTYWYEV